MIQGANPAPELVGVGAVFIDDIVLPSGQTYMRQLGGGVVHALSGAAVWGEQPGICAVIGRDLPDEIAARLQRDFDTRGLVRLAIPQIRAWQLFEEDGTRRELYRVAQVEPFIRGAQPSDLPAAYQDSRGYYLLQGFDAIQAWCAAVKGIILWEPLQQVMIPGSREMIRSILQWGRVTALSPNLLEAQAVYGDLSPETLVTVMLDDGAPIVALRMGESGSLVARRDTGECWHIPAVNVNTVIDQTGAGNTYCGAFLWGLLKQRSLAEAGAAGAVAASFCIETVSVVQPIQINSSERDKRYHVCLEAAKRL